MLQCLIQTTPSLLNQPADILKTDSELTKASSKLVFMPVRVKPVCYELCAAATARLRFITALMRSSSRITTALLCFIDHEL